MSLSLTLQSSKQSELNFWIEKDLHTRTAVHTLLRTRFIPQTTITIGKFAPVYRAKYTQFSVHRYTKKRITIPDRRKNTNSTVVDQTHSSPTNTILTRNHPRNQQPWQLLPLPHRQMLHSNPRKPIRSQSRMRRRPGN